MRRKRRARRRAQKAHAPLTTTLAAGRGWGSNKFYRSMEWKRLRYEALKLYGPRCKCCGATPEDGAVMNVDHIKPRKTHPELALEITNLQVLCSWCNAGKGNSDAIDWRTW